MPRRVTLGLLYPAPYRAALSSLAYHLVRGLFRELEAGVWEAFLGNGDPWFPRGRPPRRLGEAILSSLPYELLYPDLAVMLQALGVNPLRERRREDDPIVIAGGPAVTGNPLPVSAIADAVLVGELEPVAEGILEALGFPTRKSRLEALAEVPGMYVPELDNRPVRRVYVEDLDSAWYPVVQEVPRDVEPVWGRAFLMESSRGCARGCRFCMEGFIFRPKRDRSLGRMAEVIEDGIRTGGFGKVSFISLSFFDSPHAEGILEYVVEGLGLEVSVPSLRVDSLNERRVELIARGGQKTLTLAPETGSCRVARAIRKEIPPSTVKEVVDYAARHGIKNIKLYAIIGFPGEEDASETVEALEDVARHAARRGLRVRVSVNPFIPKPSTPLQWAPAPDPRRLRRTLSDFRRRLARVGAELDYYDPKLAVVQAVLSRGGPELGPVIVDWALEGARPSRLRRVASSRGVNVDSYLVGRDPSWTPPWMEVVEHPYAPLKLLRLEYQAFQKAMESGGCSWA